MCAELVRAESTVVHHASPASIDERWDWLQRGFLVADFCDESERKRGEWKWIPARELGTYL